MATTSTHPAIEVQGLRKTFPGGVEAVKGVDFDVAAGEVFGLLGPNGAGKSTTIGMLGTTIAPDRRDGPARRLRRRAAAARRPARRARWCSRTPSSTGRSPDGGTWRSTPASGASRPPTPRRASTALARTVRPRRDPRPAGRHLQRRPAPAARDRPRAPVEAAGAVPRRAHRRARPADPLRAARRDRRAARRGADDDPADHALPRRGRAALRPRRRGARGTDRRARLPGRRCCGALGPEIVEVRVDGDPHQALAAMRGGGVAGDDAFAVGSTVTVPCTAAGPRERSPGSPTSASTRRRSAHGRRPSTTSTSA